MYANHYESRVPYDWKTRRKYLDLPFPLAEYESRITRVKSAMEKAGIEALLIFGDTGDPGDLVYLSNFSPFGRAALIISKGAPVLITDAILHGEPINSYAWSTWIRDYRPVGHSVLEFATAIRRTIWDGHARKVGVVGWNRLPALIWEELRSADGPEWVDFWFEYTMIKSVRSDLEVSLLREVGRITAAAMKAAVESVEVGKRENQVVAVANRVMFEEGAHDRAFQTIVNSGPKSGVKHSYPTGRKLQHGDMIYLDMGALKYGYQCDMSRTVVVGGANREQTEVLDVIQEAYSTLTDMMRPGVSTSRLIEKATEIAERSRLNERYAGRIYLGLAVHHAIATSFFELPSLGLPAVRLRKSMSFAFEPMAHILDFGTAVIEDCILITRNGEESLTPYELVHW